VRADFLVLYVVGPGGVSLVAIRHAREEGYG
jgi:hypothetical protein